jgi:ankyrin repeat protein
MELLEKDPELARIEDERHGYATPLHFVSFEGQIEAATALLNAGADLHAVDTEHKGTPLQWATFGGQVEMVKWLLEHGAKVDDECFAVAVAGVKGRAYVTTQPAKYREIQKMLLAAVKKPATTRVAGNGK